MDILCYSRYIKRKDIPLLFLGSLNVQYKTRFLSFSVLKSNIHYVVPSSIHNKPNQKSIILKSVCCIVRLLKLNINVFSHFIVPVLSYLFCFFLEQNRCDIEKFMCCMQNGWRNKIVFSYTVLLYWR